MSRFIVFSLFFLAVFLQAGAYGLTFMLPKLFAGFGANEKDVGFMLMITTVATLVAVLAFVEATMAARRKLHGL